jgi:hypothetical protein
VARDKGESGVIDSYQVNYKGGLRELPKSKIGKIKLDILDDRFRLTADNNVSRKFWTDIEIPYDTVSSVDVVERNVSTFEGIAGGLNSRQLNQKNNIHFTYIGVEGPTVLRVEMLTGVSVMGQAKKCREFEDRLATHQIREKFSSVGVDSSVLSASRPAPSMADELKKLSDLKEADVLTDEEFATQKAKLLNS